MKQNVIGLKELREHTEKYIMQVQKGRSFVVVRRSRPVFKISLADDEEGLWESVVDFTKVKKGGVAMSDLLSRL